MRPTKRVEPSSTANRGKTIIDKEQYEIRDSVPIEFIERNQTHNRRKIYFKWKPVHNCQTTPNDAFLIRAMKSGIRKFQFAGHWAIEVGYYTWELWQDQTTHQIGLGEENQGPVEWTDVKVIRLSDGQIADSKETLQLIKKRKCGWTTKTDTEIRDLARNVIDTLQNRHTALGFRDRMLQWQFNTEMKLVSSIFGEKGEKTIKDMLGMQSKIRSGFLRALRGGDRSDEQYLYDIFFRNCHTFAERLAKEISTSRKRTRLFFLMRANAKTLLYNQMTLSSMQPSLVANSQNQQQQLITQQLINQQVINQQIM